jgi:hypothetical protein
MPLLQIENLTIFFGGLRAVHDFHLTIEFTSPPKAQLSSMGKTLSGCGLTKSPPGVSAEPSRICACGGI